MSNLEILLNEDKAFYPGSRIMGIIKLTVEKKMSASSIRLYFKGFEKTHFNLFGPSYYTIPAMSNCKSKDIIFDHKVILWGSDQHSFLSLSSDLDPGVLEFKFTFILPFVHLPTCMEESCGSIQYYLEAIVHRKVNNLECRRTLIVLDALSLVPELCVPMQKQIMIKQRFLLFLQTKISFTCILNKKAFLMNDAIQVTTEIMNPSTKSINGVKIALLRRTTFCGKCIYPYNFTKQKEVVDVIAEKTFPLPLVRLSVVQSRNTFEFPVRVSQSTIFGNLIKTDYSLQIDLTSEGWPLSSRINMPLTICTTTDLGTEAILLPQLRPLELEYFPSHKDGVLSGPTQHHSLPNIRTPNLPNRMSAATVGKN